MINYESKFSKLAQKIYKTRHDWVGKVIYWELAKKLKFNHTVLWYMPKPESILENDGWLVGFYGILTFVVYLMPNPFLCK